MQVETLLKRALNKEFLSAKEGEFLFHKNLYPMVNYIIQIQAMGQ